MASLRERPMLDRACKQKRQAKKVPEGEGSTLHNDLGSNLDPKLWRLLPTTLAYKVLSFLPVDMLVETLQTIDPKWDGKPWFPIFTFPHDFFGHGKNHLSTFGFVAGGDEKVFAFEHESSQWKGTFCKVPQEAFTIGKLSLGSCDGLLMFENKGTIYDEDVPEMIDSGKLIGVGNPLFGVFKWLPIHPNHVDPTWSKAYCASRQIYIMVDEQSRSYKILAHFYTRRHDVWFYTVYSSITKEWSNCLPMPVVDMFSFPIVNASSARYMCIEGCTINPPAQMRNNEEFLCCYDSEHGCWFKTPSSTPLTSLASILFPGRVYRAYCKSYHILRGQLYIMTCAMCDPVAVQPHVDNFRHWPNHVESNLFIASVDLSTLSTSTTPAFKFEFHVPDLEPILELNNAFWPDLPMFSYTKDGHGYLAVKSYNRTPFVHYNISNGKYTEHPPYPSLRSRRLNKASTVLYTPSFVVP